MPYYSEPHLDPPEPSYACEVMVLSSWHAETPEDMYCNKWDEDGVEIDGVWMCNQHYVETLQYKDEGED
jgi:hypothetical protein